MDTQTELLKALDRIYGNGGMTMKLMEAICDLRVIARKTGTDFDTAARYGALLQRRRKWTPTACSATMTSVAGRGRYCAGRAKVERANDDRLARGIVRPVRSGGRSPTCCS